VARGHLIAVRPPAGDELGQYSALAEARFGTVCCDANCIDAEVLGDLVDKNDVSVLHRFPTVEQAQAFAGSNELRQAMDRAGVKNAPRIEIAVEA